MGREILESVLGWLDELQNNVSIDKLGIIFHGGEPLTAGMAFFRQALPRLRQTFKPGRLKLNMQSNLWLLTDEFCELFAEHGLALGTSLDGPESITDAQRGQGYFRRTMAGIQLARSHGLNIGCICTFTRQSAPHADAIMNFFIQEGLDFTIHAAVPPLIDSCTDNIPGPSPVQAIPEMEADRWALAPGAFGRLLVDLLDCYLTNSQRIRISTLDLLSRSISSGEGGICTYRDCLGSYLAVTRDGSIYPCQRFAGLNSYRLGFVQDQPALEQLGRSPVWQLFREREERLQEACGGCPHFNICRGGCPYNALAAQAPGESGRFHSPKDPYCPSYQRIFSHITERALAEVFSEDNMDAMVGDPGGGTLLRKGSLLTIMRGDSRPRHH